MLAEGVDGTQLAYHQNLENALIWVSHRMRVCHCTGKTAVVDQRSRYIQPKGTMPV